MTICRYCMAEVSEREIEAEDGCCPECGAIIAAGAGYLGQDDEFEDDFDNLEEDENFEFDEEDEDGDFNEFDDDAFFEEEDDSEFAGEMEEEEPEDDDDDF